MKLNKILIFLILLYSCVNAQTGSVFSNTRFGLGLSKHFLSSAAMGMGNAGLANSDSLNLNMHNYSLWSKNKNTYFSFNVNGEINFFDLNGVKGQKSSGNISGLILSIPMISGKLNFFTTIMPKYGMEHKNLLKLQQDTEYTNDTYLVHSGHITQYDFGLAYNLNKHIQVSGNFIYYNGRYQDEFVVYFTNGQFETQNFIDVFRIKGYGTAFSSTLNFNDKIAMAVYVEKVFNCYFNSSPSTFGFGNKNEYKKRTSLPYNLGIGLGWHPTSKLNVAIDYIYKNWSAGVPTFVEDKTYFEDIHQVYSGLEYRPLIKWNSSFFEKISRRFGLFAGNEGYKVNNKSITFFGLSAGIGMPINPFGASIDIAVSYGKRGDLSNIKAEENFLKFGVSINAKEKWFVRRKN